MNRHSRAVFSINLRRPEERTERQILFDDLTFLWVEILLDSVKEEVAG